MLLCEKNLEHRFDELVKLHCHEQKTNKISATVGVLVGLRGEEDDLVVLIPSAPLPDTAQQQADAENNPLAGRTPRSAVDCMDAEWLAQHAHQTLRMLPGGLTVLGLVLLGEKPALRDLHSTVLRALKFIWKSARRMAWNRKEADRMSLVTLEIPLGKPSYMVVEGMSSSQPRTSSSRIAFQHLNLMAAECRVAISKNFLIPKAAERADFKQQFLTAIEPLVDQLDSAFCLVNGEFRPESDPLLVKTGGGKRNKKKAVEENQLLHVELMLNIPEKNDGDDDSFEGTEEVDGKKCGGRFDMKGTLQCRGVVDGNQGVVGDVVEAIKEDLLRSLYSRVELHYEGMLVVEGEEEDEAAIHQLPRRVFLPHPLHPDVWFCDYLFEGDKKEDAMESFRELLQISADSEDVLDQFEIPPSTEDLQALGLPFPAVDEYDEDKSMMVMKVPLSNGKNTQNKSLTSNKYILIAILVAMVSVIVYIILNQIQAQ